jgi:hypothetical protein
MSSLPITPVPPLHPLSSAYLPPVPPPPHDPDTEDVNHAIPYGLSDDMEILKFIGAYYGMNFHGKLPWSAWQTFKRTTGSSRSTSSLYHHWNGAMKKRYGAFLETGKLNDCIQWLETAMSAVQQQQVQPSIDDLLQHSGTRLAHVTSLPNSPIDETFETSQPLVRTPSFVLSQDISFFPPK